MYYSSIKKNSIANGPGVRVDLFVSGCSLSCPRMLQLRDLGLQVR